MDASSLDNGSVDLIAIEHDLITHKSDHYTVAYLRRWRLFAKPSDRMA